MGTGGEFMSDRNELWMSIAARAILVAVIVALGAGMAFAQDSDRKNGSPLSHNAGTANQAFDPGVRGGPPSAGGPLQNLLTPDLLNFFNAALVRFQEVDSVSGGFANESGVGLGPRFNMNSCSGCHAQPAFGGSSPTTNPQYTVANLDQASNQIPPFVTQNG